MTVPTTHTVLDEHTEAELQPPCEIRSVYMCPIHGTHKERCEQAAAWIARTTCACGRTDTDLVCDKHANDIRTGDGRAICHACGAVNAGDRIHLERI